MTSIYISNIISFEAFVLAFAFIFQSLPGNWYKDKIAFIQLILMSTAFFTGLYTFVISGLLADEISSLNSAYHQDGMGIFLFLYSLFFFLSIYRYYVYKKGIKDIVSVEIQVTADEYTVMKEVDLMLGETMYFPNVKAYAQYQDSVIMFSGTVPDNGRALKLYCYQLEDKLYACYAFEELDKKFSLRKAFSAFVTLCVFLSAMYLPFLFVQADIVDINGGNPADYGDLFGAIVLLILGVTVSRILKGAKGILAKIIYIVCILAILSSLFYFYRSAKLLLGVF